MFKSEQVVFKKLNKLPIARRVSVASSPEGKSVLASLTPSQFAELFPRYYQQALPDVGGFDKATTEAARERQAEASEGILDRLMKAEKGLEEYAGEKYHQIKRKLGFEPKAPPGLSPEQEAAWNKVMSGAVDVNSAEGKQFGRLTDSQLSSIGLTRGKDNTGRDVFQYAQPEVSRQEAESRLKTSGSVEHPQGKSGYRMVYEAAKRMGDKFPEVTAAQWAHESNWGKAPSGKNNVFGQKARAGEEGTVVGTHENYGGGSVAIRDKFKDYNSIEEGIADHVNRWSSKYKNARNAQEAVEILKNSGYATDPAYVSKVMNFVGSHEKYMNEAGASGGIAIKPEGPNGSYSDEQITKMMGQLKDEKNSARKQQLANLLTDAGVPTATVNSISSVNTSGVTGEHFGESKQCVALTKHFATNVGPASSWQFHDDTSGIVPGAAIATTRYSDGSGGRMASQMPDGKSHYHTGIALTKPDADGNVLIFDQSAGKGSSITKINIHNYHGEQWRPIRGGEPTDKSMQAVNMALGRANESEKSAIMESMRGKAPTAPTSTPEIKPVVESGPPPQTPVNQEGQPVAPAQQPLPGERKPASTATVNPPTEGPKAKPAPLPNRYTVDRTGFINAIKNTEEFKNTMFSSLASDQQIIDGFNSDAKVQAAGVRYDAEKGVMHFKDPNHPDIKAVMQDLHTEKFMTPIQEKKPEPVPEKKVEAPPQKPQPSQQPTPTQGAGPTPAQQPKSSQGPGANPSQQPTPTQGDGPTPAQQPTPQRQTSAEVEPLQEAPQVEGASDGGSFGVNGDVNFYPMDKRDNLAAVDTKTQQPLFTARGGERIDVTPAQKVRGEMGPADNGIRNEFEALRQEMGSNFGTLNEPTKPTMAQTHRKQNPDVVPTFTGGLNEQNKSNQYHNPAFERAMMRTRLQESGDPLNNHFSGGNTNYS